MTGAVRSPYGRLDVELSFEVKGTRTARTALRLRLATLGAVPTVDSFLACQYQALRITRSWRSMASARSSAGRSHVAVDEVDAHSSCVASRSGSFRWSGCRIAEGLRPAIILAAICGNTRSQNEESATFEHPQRECALRVAGFSAVPTYLTASSVLMRVAGKRGVALGGCEERPAAGRASGDDGAAGRGSRQPAASSSLYCARRC